MTPHLARSVLGGAALVFLGLSFAAMTPPARAASPASSLVTVPLPAEALLVPPPSGKAGPPGFDEGFAPAPVPDPDLQRPRSDRQAEQPRTQVMPKLFSESERRNGDGFVKGSAAQYDPDRRLRPSPGVNLRVPLQ